MYKRQLVLIACDANGVITGAEVMEGLTFLTKFRPCDEVLGYRLIGTHIQEFLAFSRQLDKKKKKRLKGYIQAVEALELRLSSDGQDVDPVQPTAG